MAVVLDVITMSRARNYVFTWFGDFDALNHGADQISYICWGEETCPDTSRQHLQGYVEFSSAYSLARAKTILGDAGVHLEPRRGSAKQAVAYCRKDGVFTEHGVARVQGKRRDLDEIRAAVGDGHGIRHIIGLGVSYQGIRCVRLVVPGQVCAGVLTRSISGPCRMGEKLLSYCERRRSSPPEVLWYWGPTGTGKSRAAGAEAADRAAGPDDVYWHPGGKWFDGYDGHGAVIFDDFRPEDMKFQRLLKLLDRYPFRVEVKGGARQFDSGLIFITCPKPPSECYLEAGEELGQLLRRINVIKEFT